jgi:hypothetical protein
VKIARYVVGSSSGYPVISTPKIRVFHLSVVHSVQFGYKFEANIYNFLLTILRILTSFRFERYTLNTINQSNESTDLQPSFDVSNSRISKFRLI